ncbi:tektin-1 [Fopius arisanus]|uniref:Tektin n=1 Tax=Fopius arisanus TaxID=64838 RepID=A0A9R1TV70_9HYME|nr:PREDICTED: tektin-1 [Fopius arisanus]
MANWGDKRVQGVEIIPPPPPRFTMSEWSLNNQERHRACTTNCELVESLIEESHRLCDMTNEKTRRNKLATDRELEGQSENIKFCRDELLRARKKIVLEVDSLFAYKSRITDALASVRRNAAVICENCLISREHRRGIDLTLDEVDKQLRMELKVIHGAETTFTRTLEETSEEIRALKSILYSVDRNLQDKHQNFIVERENLNIRETSMNLSIYHGTSSLDSSTLTMQEWEILSNELITDGKKELNSSKLLRNYVDTILREITNDLNDQITTTNDAFQQRIRETKEAKMELESQHSKIIEKANDMTMNIARLQKMIAEKEGFIALNHTRLGNRCRRPQLERTADAVERQLLSECADLSDSVTQLQQTLHETQAALRYLLKTQIQVEEDINVKVNTLKIDEVECMGMRESLSFHAY